MIGAAVAERPKTEKSHSCSKSAGDLWTIYNQADTHHRSLFAEQRSNLLLVAGLHYTNKDSKFSQRLREIETVTKTQKIRLTKNHLQRITKTYTNNLLMYAPAVGVSPKNDAELSDVKVAEMHKSVWDDMRERHKFSRLTRQWARDFVELGECIAKVFFDQNHGSFLGYDPLYDEMGNVVQDEQGQPVYNPSPVFTGDVVFERILGFNLLTDWNARSWEECQWVIYRKMVPIADLRRQFEGDPQKLAMLSVGVEETLKIFDATTGNYRDGDGLIMVTEHYYRPCADMPEGYYYFSVQGGILFEGELPLGLFPIVYAGFDEASTSARSYSIIKQLRPFQAEINRAASKIAEHQITLGDDKVILSNGALMTPGGTAHGVKAIHVTGADPKVFPGRTGDQYAPYMASQISEMYQVAMVEEDSREKESGTIDPFAILYKTAKQKKPFMIYIQKFEEFLVDVCKLALRFAKAFYSDEMMVPVVGKKEMVNIEEFRRSEDLGYQIKVEATTEDLETKMGKQLTLNHLIQYAGGQLDPSDIGKLTRSMPWLNGEQILDDQTQDWDSWVNDRLALDRGKQIPAQEGENHAYIIKKLRSRMKDTDFEMLPPPVQQNYQMKLDQHVQFEAAQIRQAQALKDGFIPSGGYLVTVEFYVADPNNPAKQVRLRLPTESVQWLKERLDLQGSSQEILNGFDVATQAQMAQMQQQGMKRVGPGVSPDQAMPMAV